MQRIIITVSDRRDLKGLLSSEFAKVAGPSPQSKGLKAELQRADIVCPEEAPPDVVKLKSEVVLRDLETGERRNYTLVFPHDADAAAGRLSVLAPLGTAILGERVGSRVHGPDSAGRRRFRIENSVHHPKQESVFYPG